MDKWDLMEALNEVDDKLVAEASEARQTIAAPTRSRRRLILVAAGSVTLLAAAILLVVLLPGMKRNGSLSGGGQGQKEVSMIKPWDEMTIREQYSEVTLRDLRYSSTAGVCALDTLSEPLGEATAMGMEFVDGYVQRTIEVQLYRICDVAEEFAIAVAFAGDDTRYVYVNPDFACETYGEWASAINLNEYLTVWQVYTSSNRITGRKDDKTTEMKSIELVQKEQLLDLLLPEASIPMYMQQELPKSFLYGEDEWTYEAGEEGVTYTKSYDPNPSIEREDYLRALEGRSYGEVVASISVDFSLLGQKNVTISVRDTGFVETNIGHTGKCFDVGVERVDGFVEYLKTLTFTKAR